METPEIGDKVRVTSTAACAGEGISHGYHPYVKGLEGVIVALLEQPFQSCEHPCRVDFGKNLSLPGWTPLTWSYFKASELELVVASK